MMFGVIWSALFVISASNPSIKAEEHHSKDSSFVNWKESHEANIAIEQNEEKQQEILDETNLCNFSTSSFICDQEKCKCGEINLSESDVYILTGQSSANSVILENVTKTIILRDFHYKGASILDDSTSGEFTLNNSHIHLLIDGSNDILQSSTESKAGIGCSFGSSLEISPFNNNSEITHSLSVSGDSNAAGIGLGGNGGCCKSIIINEGISMNVKAYGSGSAIGGCGKTTSGINETLDEIIINGGELTLSSVSAGGIGSKTLTVMKNITINGGNISIKCSGAPGIGGGSSIDNININGGKINIESKSSPGIGTTQNSKLDTIHITNGELNIKSSQSPCIGPNMNAKYSINKIIIDDGNITTRTIQPIGAKCAGIGGGTAKTANVELIEINGGIIDCESEYGAGIGSGQNSNIGIIQINGGDIVSRSLESGPGIGAGVGSSSNKNSGYVGLINITGGTINATGKHAAGIGAGKGEGSYSEITNQSSVGRIEIWGGKINSKSIDSAGIGGGYGYTEGSSEVGEIFIGGGYIESEGIVGIGASRSDNAGKKSGEVGIIHITGGTILSNGTISGIGCGYETSIENITIEGGNIESIGQSNGAGIGCGSNSSITFINIFGGNIQTRTEESGPGIGCSCVEANSQSSISMIQILNGRVESRGQNYSSGIGGGETFDINSTTIEHLYLNGSIIHGYGGEYGSGIGGGYNSSINQVTLGVGPDFIEIIGKGGNHSESGIGQGGPNGIIHNLILLEGVLDCNETTKVCSFKSDINQTQSMTFAPTDTEVFSNHITEIVTQEPTIVPTISLTPTINDTSDELVIEKETTDSDEIIITENGFRDHTNKTVDLSQKEGTVTIVEVMTDTINVSGKSKPLAEFYLSATKPNTTINIDVNQSDLSVAEFGIHANDKKPIVNVPSDVNNIPLNLMATSSNSKVELKTTESTNIFGINNITTHDGHLDIMLSNNLQEFHVKNLNVYLNSQFSVSTTHSRSSQSLQTRKEMKENKKLEIISKDIYINKGGSLGINDVNIKEGLTFEDISKLIIHNQIIFQKESIIRINRQQNIENTYIILGQDSIFEGKPSKIDILVKKEIDLNETNDFNIVCGISQKQCEELSTLISKTSSNIYKYGKCSEINEQICLVASSKNSEKQSSGLKGGEIAGIVIGCIAAIIIVTVIIVIIRKKKQHDETSSSSGKSSSDLLSDGSSNMV
ncbi:hypothetical protein TRFO_28796 [Tritrichomonas foetus]|uniref:Uncharacterized protein n=1 Tax=Tritrichomonas foetus TaxID=1144522 RepID=A0A1J4JYX1_9EUKA|nr:hypothetical protein TRFO_28796 [Tritrichomonas foetus]|eukprot:OHT03890.1 hypothetical protein TRFO_28796 [Tritrichomonas foetus]